jgi:hypothetical protein
VTLLLRRCREQADLNAFITIDENVVLEAAENADLYRKSNKTLGPLHGVPIAVKDSYNTHDYPTSIATKALTGFRPQKDAAVLLPLRAAGAIILGKNNLVFPSSCAGLPGISITTGSTAFFAQAAIDNDDKAIGNMSQMQASRDVKSHASHNHWIAEQILDRSGIPTTHLRPTLFAEWLLYLRGAGHQR